jgi:hypothetical protein
MLIPFDCSAFLGGILHVIGISAEKQVRRVAANWIIACMTNKQAIGYGTISQDISHAMGKNPAPTSAQLPVAFPVFVGNPGPASIGASRLVNMRPETGGDIRGIGANLVFALARPAAILPPALRNLVAMTVKRLSTILANTLNHLALLNGDTRSLGGSCRGNSRVRLRVPYKVKTALRDPFPRQLQYSMSGISSQ